MPGGPVKTIIQPLETHHSVISRPQRLNWKCWKNHHTHHPSSMPAISQAHRPAQQCSPTRNFRTTRASLAWVFWSRLWAALRRRPSSPLVRSRKPSPLTSRAPRRWALSRSKLITRALHSRKHIRITCRIWILRSKPKWSMLAKIIVLAPFWSSMKDWTRREFKDQARRGVSLKVLCNDRNYNRSSKEANIKPLHKWPKRANSNITLAIVKSKDCRIISSGINPLISSLSAMLKTKLCKRSRSLPKCEKRLPTDKNKTT